MLRVGIIAATHGIKGEVKVYPTTEEPMRFKKLKQAYIDTGEEKLVFEIEQVRFFKKYVILKFKDINSINDIEKYKGRDLLIDREQAVPLEQDEFFISDLIGLRVVNEEGKILGVLKEVLPTGANDVYIVELENQKELLLPAIKQCILKTDLEQGQMIVHVMEGLMEL